MRSWIALAAFLLIGCLLDPEEKKKPDKIINVPCEYDHVDSNGVSVWICPINDSTEPTPPEHPNASGH